MEIEEGEAGEIEKTVNDTPTIVAEKENLNT